MKFIFIFVSLVSFGCLASNFKCEKDSQCGHGVCSEFTHACQCDEGYVDHKHRPCFHLPRPYLPAVILSATGGILPAMLVYHYVQNARLTAITLAAVPLGELYLGLWDMFSWRLGLTLGAVGTTYLAASAENAFPRSSKVRTFAHTGSGILVLLQMQAWVSSTASIFRDHLWHYFANKHKGEADLVIIAKKMASSTRVTLETFEKDSCAMQEGCVDGPGERRLLRFDSWIYNKGEADFVMFFEGVRPEWSSCHQHYHAPEATNYLFTQRLMDANDTEVAKGHKQGYCFRDNTQVSVKNGDFLPKYNCGIPRLTKEFTQGITAGWADIYHGNLDCQWIDITGVPPGTYYLSVTFNPTGVYVQDSAVYNNLSVVKVEIPAVDESLERVQIAGTELALHDKIVGRRVNATVYKEYE